MDDLKGDFRVRAVNLFGYAKTPPWPAVRTQTLDDQARLVEAVLPTNADELRHNFAALTIQTSPEVAQQAIDAIRAGAGTGNWALLGNNCTSSCAKVLREIGLLS